MVKERKKERKSKTERVVDDARNYEDLEDNACEEHMLLGAVRAPWNSE